MQHKWKDRFRCTATNMRTLALTAATAVVVVVGALGLRAGMPAAAQQGSGTVVESKSLPGGGEIETIRKGDGTMFVRVRGPKLDNDQPDWSADVTTSAGTVRLQASLSGPGVSPKTASRYPVVLGRSTGASSATLFRSCQTGWARGLPVWPFQAWVNLTTSWNYDYSTTWGASNSTQKVDGAGYEWRDVDKWLSNVGQPYAFSDADGELWMAA